LQLDYSDLNKLIDVDVTSSRPSQGIRRQSAQNMPVIGSSESN